jgi:membrane dipeptidase
MARRRGPGRGGGRAAALHRDAVVIDLVCPLAVEEGRLDEWIRGGVTAIGPTVAADDGCAGAMRNVAMWHERLRRLRSKLLHVTRVEHVRQARRRGRLGIIFHFQNTLPFERDPALIELYYRLGVRVVSPTTPATGWATAARRPTTPGCRRSAGRSSAR